MVPVEDDSATQKPVRSTAPGGNSLIEIKNPGNKLQSTPVAIDATPASTGSMSFLQQISSKEFKLRAVYEAKPSTPQMKVSRPPDFLSAIKSAVKLPRREILSSVPRALVFEAYKLWLHYEIRRDDITLKVKKKNKKTTDISGIIHVSCNDMIAPLEIIWFWRIFHFIRF